MEREKLKCEKLKMGMVTYFHGLTLKEYCVLFWKVIRRRKNGSNTYKYLTQMSQKAVFYGNLNKDYITKNDIKIRIRIYSVKKTRVGIQTNILGNNN